MGQITSKSTSLQTEFPELNKAQEIHYQLPPEILIKAALERKEGYLTDHDF